MAGSSPIPTLPSGAEGTGSALENTFAPRLRTALKNTKNHPASTTSSLRESSATDTDESVKQDNNDSNMRASRVAIMAAMISSLVSLPQPAKEDYFGPLHYSRVEFSWFLLLAVLALLAFGLACVLTEIAVYLSMCGDACFGWLERSSVFISAATITSPVMCFVACLQWIKYKCDRKKLKKQFTNETLTMISDSFYDRIFTVLTILTVMQLLSVGLLGLWGYYGIHLPVIFYHIVFLLIQCVYWPLHGLMLHAAVTAGRRQNHTDMVQNLAGARREKVTYNIGRFLLIFMGSGGHTTEMLSLVKLMEPFDNSMFRRYIITTGDDRSKAEVEKYESERESRFRGTHKLRGTFEIVWVARARYVRQSWFTTPFTAIGCVLDCHRILKKGRPLADAGSPAEFPQTILCNGPGSAAVFVWVAHVMRLYGAIPVNRCVTLFVESIARVTSLSLTGKIFYYGDLADTFVVQHGGIVPTYPNVVVEPMLVRRVYTAQDVPGAFADF